MVDSIVVSAVGSLLARGRGRVGAVLVYCAEDMLESVVSNLKEQMRLERHLARAAAGLPSGIAQRIPAFTLGMLLNTLTGRPHPLSPPYEGR